ncbi:MAG: choice-of-anchor D domain-containing protein, partial [Ignavibacteriae bacterium]
NAVSHRLTSNGKIKFGGYVYGYGAVDAYGWMVATAARPSSPRDTMPPGLTSRLDCGDARYVATELRNIPDPVSAVPLDSDQVESGIAEIDTVTGSNSFNYMLILVTDTVLPRDPSYKRFAFRWEVIDRSRDAYCDFYVRDWYGNITTDTIRYSAPKLTISPDVINFGEQQLGASDTMTVTITNASSQPVSLLNASLEIGDYYSIIGKTFPPTFVLQPNASTTVSIRYDARRETNDVRADFDHDTMMIFLEECVYYNVGMRGVASQSLIDVEDYSAGYIAPGELTCKPNGLRITNNGSDTLVVTGFTGYGNTNFSVTPSAVTGLPFVILPKQSYQMKDVCYKRTDEGTDSIDVTFASNSLGPKPTSTWTGRTMVTSVEEDALDQVVISIANGTITASWQGASVSRIIVHDVKGQTIASTDVASGMEQARVSLPPLAHQQLFVTLLSASGSVLHHTVLVAP